MCNRTRGNKRVVRQILRAIDRCVLASLILFLAACATSPKPVSPHEPEAQKTQTGSTPAITTPPPAVNNEASSSPVLGLLDQARDLRRAGNYDASFSRLERALRIAPQSAAVYLELAKTHQAVGDTERAAASAQRGLLYCSGVQCRSLRRYAKRANQ